MTATKPAGRKGVKYKVEASHKHDGPWMHEGEFVRKCDASRVANRLRRIGMYARVRSV